MQVSAKRQIIADDIRIAAQNVEFQSGLALKAATRGHETACLMHAQAADMYYLDLCRSSDEYLSTFTIRGNNAEHDK